MIAPSRPLLANLPPPTKIGSPAVSAYLAEVNCLWDGRWGYLITGLTFVSSCNCILSNPSYQTVMLGGVKKIAEMRHRQGWWGVNDKAWFLMQKVSI